MANMLYLGYMTDGEIMFMKTIAITMMSLGMEQINKGATYQKVRTTTRYTFL